MRLTCPNCSAQYEVPDEVIPEDGRDVQCSNCDHTWFQAKHPAEPAAEPDTVVAVQAEPTEVKEAEVSEAEPEAESPAPDPEPDIKPAESPAVGNVDPAVAGILQEEAAREAELRAREGDGLEVQQDMALDSVLEPEFELRQSSVTETSEAAGQKDELPDVEAINSSLRGDSTADQEPPARKSGSFVRGFALILIIGVVLFLIYSNAQQISQAVPQVDPILNSYVSLVDQARIWLETQAGSGASQN